MSKKILVTGIEESGKDTILDLVLKGSKKMLPKFRYLKFGKILKMAGTAEMKNLQNNLIEKIKRSIRKDYNTIINGDFTVKTSHGFLPLITKDFFMTVNPDVSILLEFETNLKDIYLRHEIKHLDVDLESIREQQFINKHHAIACSHATGALLKIIRVEHGNVKKAIREVSETIKFSLKS